MRYALAAAVCLLASPAFAQEADDAWSEPFFLKGDSGPLDFAESLADGFVMPVHAALLPDGRILVVGGVRPMEVIEILAPGGWGLGPYGTPPFVGTFSIHPSGEVPAEEPLERTDLPIDRPFWTEVDSGGELAYSWDSIFCGSHTLTSDGRFFAAGGTRIEQPGAPALDDANLGLGIDYGVVLNPTTMEWERTATFSGRGPAEYEQMRWYPSVMRLVDGRILLLNGIAKFRPDWVDGEGNKTVEIYNPDAGTWELVSAHPADATMPQDFPRTPQESWGSPYAHIHQLPEPIPGGGGFDIFITGDLGKPTFLSLDGPARWLVRDNPRPGLRTDLWAMNFHSTSSLLPLRLEPEGWSNGTVLIAGGGCYGVELNQSPIDGQLDIYDPVTDTWRTPSIDLGVGRHHGASVVLPDGRIAIFGGYDECQDRTNPLLGKAQIVDPFDDFSVVEGAASATEELDGEELPEVRGYHLVTLLLPDGRVLVGGGRYGSGTLTERASMRYWSPPYVSQPRPQIEEAPDTIEYGTEFTVRWSGDATPVEAVLTGLGSMTHSFDFNQRHVQLAFTAHEDGTATVLPPPHRRWATPGHYMLWILDGDRVPSEGWIVRLDGDGQPPDDPGPGVDVDGIGGPFGAVGPAPGKKGCLGAAPGLPTGGGVAWVMLAALAAIGRARRSRR